MSNSPSRSPIRVLALMEARTVTGPAKNLLSFAVNARPAVDLSIAAFQRPSVPIDAFAQAILDRGLTFHPIPEKHLGDLAVVGRLRRLVRQLQPDIIQTHNSKSHLLLRTSGIARQIPWIAYHHGFTRTDWRDRLYTVMGRWALTGAPRLVTVCQAFADQLIAAGASPERISILHNSVLPYRKPPEEELTRLRATLGIPLTAAVLLAVGRFSAEKGHADLIEAVAQLQTARDFRLLLVGDGPERYNLQIAAARAGLTHKLILPGHQTDVRPFYGIADIFVLPSHSEGSPNVLLEAMAAGLPIAATAVGGAKELVTGQVSALLVPPSDPGALAQALVQLLTDPAQAQRLAQKAQSDATLYTPEAYAQSLIDLYRAALGG